MFTYKHQMSDHTSESINSLGTFVQGWFTITLDSCAKQPLINVIH